MNDTSVTSFPESVKVIDKTTSSALGVGLDPKTISNVYTSNDDARVDGRI